jgi:hypothetical protein
LDHRIKFTDRLNKISPTNRVAEVDLELLGRIRTSGTS